MKEYYLTLSEQRDSLEALVHKLRVSGCISLETADELNSLVPGQIQAIDPDVEFDYEDSTQGHNIALEAAVTGLDRIKVAFVVAAIAFILKYIANMGNKNTFSFSGGGAGGWGGSAPPAFVPTALPGSPKATEEEAEYNDLLVEDLAKNIDSFKEIYSDVNPSLTSKEALKGIVSTKAYGSLIRVVSRIYNANADKDKFNLFGVSSPYDVFKDPELALKSDKTLTILPQFLKWVNDQYTTGVVFQAYKGERLKLLPYMINKNLTEPVKEIIAIGNKYLANPQSIETKLEEVIAINGRISAKNDPIKTAEEFIHWVTKNFIIAESNAGSKNDLTQFIKAVLSVPVDGVPGIELSTSITQNNGFLNVVQGKTYLRDLFKTLSGVETNQHGISDDQKNVKDTDSYIISLSKNGVEAANRQYKLGEMAELIETFRENLTDGGAVEKLLAAAKQYVTEYAQIAEDAKSEENRIEEDDDKAVGYAKSLKHHQAYVQNAIDSLVTIIAGYTNLSNQLTKFSTARIETYTTKLQTMNVDYYTLTRSLHAVKAEIKP